MAHQKGVSLKSGDVQKILHPLKPIKLHGSSANSSTAIGAKVSKIFRLKIIAALGILIIVLAYFTNPKKINLKTITILKSSNYLQKRVALCLAGNEGALGQRAVQKSIFQNFVEPFNNPSNTDIYFSLRPNSGCPNEEDGNLDLTTFSVNRPVPRNFDCSIPLHKNNTCCNVEKNSNETRSGNPENWVLWEVLMHQVSTILRALETEKKTGLVYDWFIIAKPSLYFFEKLIFSADTLISNRTYTTSIRYKDGGVFEADSILIVPRDHIDGLLNVLAHEFSGDCKDGGSPARSTLPTILDILRERNVPVQTLPIFFATVDCDGKFDCKKLNNKALYLNRVGIMRRNGVPAERFCESRSKQNIFGEVSQIKEEWDASTDTAWADFDD